MNKLLKTLWVITASLILACLGMRAEETVPPPMQIPSEVFLKGRQNVASFAARKVTGGYFKFMGKSLSSDAYKYFGIGDLKDHGYKLAGDTTQLVNAIIQIAGEIELTLIRVNGQYDIHPELVLQGDDGTAYLVGRGYTEIQTEKGGGLVVGTEISLSLNDAFDVLFRNASAAKIVGDGFEIELPVNPFTGFVTIPSGYLENGLLLVTQYFGESGKPTLTAYNLADGTSETGEAAVVRVQGVYHYDYFGYTDNLNFFDGESFIYTDGENYYGRVPLVNLQLTQPVVGQVIHPLIPVWSSAIKLQPRAIYTLRLTEPGTPGEREKPLQYDPTRGGWILDLEPGSYHIKIVVDGLREGPKG